MVTWTSLTGRNTVSARRADDGSHRPRLGGRRAALIGIAALLGLVSGCAEAPANTTPGEGLSGDPYVIGNLTHQNTTFAQLPKANTETPLAWEKWTNEHGGINGHPVKVVSYDTQSDNAKAVVMAKQLVEESKVIAMAGNNDPTSEPAYAEYLTEKGIPVVGSAHSTLAYKNANFFPTAATDYAVLSPSVIAAALAANIKNYGLVYCTESPLCKSDVDGQAAAADDMGLHVAANFSASLSAANYTAECVKLKDANVDGVYFSATASAIAKMATDCQRQGMNLKFFFLEPSPDLQKTPAVYEAGAVGISVALPYFAEVEANKDYHDAMAKYAPGIDLTSDGAQMWAGLEVLKAALEQVPDEPMTPETVKKGLYALPMDFTADGLTVPLSYTSGKPFAPKCVFTWELGSDGKYSVTNGGKTTCL